MRNSIHITLPPRMGKWVKQQAASKGFDTETFLLEMIQREKDLAERDKVEDLIIQALDSGEPEPVTAATWERIRARGKKLLKERRRK